MHFASGAMVGDIQRNSGDRQVGIAGQVMVGQYDVAQMLAIGGYKPVSPGIGGQAKLTAATCWLQTAGNIRFEAKAPPAQFDWRYLRILFFQVSDRAALAAGAGVHPIVESPLKPAEELLNIGDIEAAVQNSFLSRLAGARVLKKEKVRRIGDQQAPAIRHDRRRKTQAVREYPARFEKAVAVFVLKHFDLAGTDIAYADSAIGVAMHFSDEQATLLVQCHGHRI